ncbi:MAG: hypothetical protein QW453_04735 [Thermoprotei archaeon]
MDPQAGRHYTETKRLGGYLSAVRSTPYKSYNQSLELEDSTLVVRQRLLAKVIVKKGQLEFE